MTPHVKRFAAALALLGALAVLVAPAEGRKHRSHKPAGVEGTVLDASCYGACVEPRPPEPVYTGAATVTVKRSSDGAQVASQAVSDGHFRMKVKHGIYDVSVVPQNPTPSPCQPTAQAVCPPPCQPAPQTICPLESTSSPTVVIAPCLTGDTQHVSVRRHRFAHVDLHVNNVCIV
jgi:hypothetical protein